MAKEIIHRFEISYGIPDSKLKESQQFMDLIQKGILGLKDFARDINPKEPNQEITTSAKYHACKHELGQPCATPIDIWNLDVTKMEAQAMEEPIEEELIK